MTSITEKDILQYLPMKKVYPIVLFLNNIIPIGSRELQAGAAADDESALVPRHAKSRRSFQSASGLLQAQSSGQQH